jgi:hypothetical protein
VRDARLDGTTRSLPRTLPAELNGMRNQLARKQTLGRSQRDLLLLFERRSPIAAMQRLRSVAVAASKSGNCHEAAIGQASIEPSL